MGGAFEGRISWFCLLSSAHARAMAAFLARVRLTMLLDGRRVAERGTFLATSRRAQARQAIGLFETKLPTPISDHHGFRCGRTSAPFAVDPPRYRPVLHLIFDRQGAAKTEAMS
jgi:hypothetical protein